jgi:hypothetical protein
MITFDCGGGAAESIGSPFEADSSWTFTIGPG